MDNSDKLKLCKSCSLEKPLSEFYKRSSKHPNSYRLKCKACTIKDVKKYDQSHVGQKSKQAAIRLANKRQKALDEYIDKHGHPPFCSCGCGEHVEITNHLVPRKLKAGHYMPGATKDDVVPTEKVRFILLKAKKEKNLTVQELADLLGFSKGRLTTMMNDKNSYRYGIAKDEALHILNRIYGKATKPTPYELKKFKEDVMVVLPGNNQVVRRAK